MRNELNSLNHVFINISENKIIPVNILFNSQIVEIERLTENEFEWKDIDTLEKKEQAIKRISKSKQRENIKNIEGDFNLLLPGAIDPHVHFDTPGFEFRDTFEHGSTAAAYGGVTTVIDMPCTSLPPVTSLSNFNEKLKIVRSRSLVDFAFWGGVCRNDIEKGKDIQKNVNELDEAGVAAYKTYVISGMDTFKDLSYDQLKNIAELICSTGKPMGVHAEDKFLVESRRTEFKANDLNSWEYYCQARDSEAEKTAVEEMISISKETGARVHIVHLSSKAGLNLIRDARGDGVNINTETCPHYLYFTQTDFNNEKIRNYLKTAPPVKDKEDIEALWEGLRDGSISFVTTDHAGCDPAEEKISNNFWDVYGGIPGVEHRLPILFSEGFKRNKLNLENLIRLLSTNSAEYYNLPNKGSLKPGFDADFAMINLWKGEIIESAKMHSKGKYTPFEGYESLCRVEKTILRGKTIMDRYNEPEENIGFGNFIEVH